MTGQDFLRNFFRITCNELVAGTRNLLPHRKERVDPKNGRPSEEFPQGKSKGSRVLAGLVVGKGSRKHHLAPPILWKQSMSAANCTVAGAPRNRAGVRRFHSKAPRNSYFRGAFACAGAVRRLPSYR